MKTKNISIFIAGATALGKERTAFKAIANDLNSEFENKGIHITIRSYENFNESQNEYNNFIRNKTDLIIFVLDGRIGPETKNEFVVANECRHTNRRPDIIVFLKDFDEVTPDIAFIQGLLTTTTGEYWIKYHNETDLIAKAEKRIRKYVNEHEFSAHKTRKTTTSSFRKISKYALSLLLLLAVFATSVFAYRQIDNIFLTKQEAKRDQPILLICGGGSAFNFANKIIKNPDDSICNNNRFFLHMPSGSAWIMITEEAISRQKDKKGQKSREQRYFPVCLSAGQAKTEDFLADRIKISDFQRKVIVLANKLGDDELTAYLYTDGAHLLDLLPESAKANFKKGEITTTDLANLIINHEKLNLNLYTTGKDSGTRKQYCLALNNIDGKGFDFDKYPTDEFSEDTDAGKIKIPYLILGSSNYELNAHSNLKDSGDVVALKVIDAVGNTITKPIYLYTVAYRTEETGEWWLPQPSLDLLHAFGINTDGKIKDNKFKSTIPDTEIIQDFDKITE